MLQDLETVTPAEAAERIRQAEALAKMAAHERIQVERRNLPMYKFRTELMEAIAAYQIIIVVAETGSGKTTQVYRAKSWVGHNLAGCLTELQPLCGFVASYGSMCTSASHQVCG